MYNIKVRMSKLLGFLLTLAMLLYTGQSIDWQGTGNMSQENLTQIWSYIKANFQKSYPKRILINAGDTKLADFATGLSENLNSLWNPAWNVVLIYNYDRYKVDTVVYGYAFRDHWMWYNGYTMDDDYSVSFVIWKDYNCITWYTHNYNTVDFTGGYYIGSYNVSTSSAIRQAIQALQSSFSSNDIWTVAKDSSDAIPAYPGVNSIIGSDIAFSVLVSSSGSVCYFGRFCAKNYMANYKRVGSNGGYWGAGLVLQMR